MHCLVSLSSCCSYHRRWNKIVSVRRPSLWHFIRRVKDEEARIRRTVQQVRSGMLQQERRSKWRRLEQRIVRLKDQYRSGVITLREYWNAARYVTNTH